MANWAQNFILAFFILVSYPAFSSSLHFDISGLHPNDWELSRLHLFLSQVDQSLPEEVKKNIPQTLFVEFADLSSGDAESDFSLIARECVFDKNSKATKNKIIQKAGSNKVVFGKRYIILNKLFWNEILKGPESATKYDCGHKNSYQLALATLIHEIGHVYDEVKKVSADRRFLHLTTFTKSFLLGMAQKNKMTRQSVDKYEFFSPEESFAVNLEYFLLDREFQCRRPSLYSYYSEKLNVKPFPNPACHIDRNINVTGFTNNKITLDPSRLYRVDYFLASEGSGITSRFGHSMLRMIFCPQGKYRPEECVNDSSNHVIVSFRANMMDDKNSGKKTKQNALMSLLTSVKDQFNYYIKGLGLNGSFPSKMFLMSVPFIVSEYNNFEYRDLVSTPLKLSQDEKNDLVNRILEINAGYEGSYGFLTNNCRTETEDLLKSVLRTTKIAELSGVTPVSMRESLYQLNLVDKNQKELTHPSLSKSIFENSEEFRHTYFSKSVPSQKLPIAKFIAFANFIKPETMNSFVTNFDYKQRRDFFTAIKKEFNSETLLTNLTSLETAALLFNTMSYFIADLNSRNMIENEFESFSDILTPQEIAQFNREKEIIRQSQALPKQNTNVFSYGVPLLNDRSESQITGSYKKETLERLTDVLKKVTEAEKIEFEGTQENINLFVDTIFGPAPN